MWAEMFPSETAAALADRAANPVPLAPPKRSTWADLGQLLAAPLTGAAQGVNESLRVLNRLGSARPLNAERDRPAGLLPWLDEAPGMKRARETSRANAEAAFQQSDDALRRGAEYWRPDPMTAGWATNYLHDAGRVVAKFAGYSLLGGAPGAVAGTGIDEGVTSYLGLRDQGVDADTSAKVGALHGAVTAATAGIAPFGATPLRSALLVGVSGPGAFMAESALSREILQRADYPQLAATFDPFDSLGLALSLVPGAAIATGVHAARSRAAARGQTLPPEGRVPPPPEAVEAAHVQLQRDLIDAGNLGRADDPVATVVHGQALDEARAAMDSGRRIELPGQVVDEARAAPVMAHLDEQLRAADVPRLVEEARAEPMVGMEASPAVASDGVPPAAGTADKVPASRAPVQRALDAIRDRPDLPVRLEDDGSPATPASDLARTEAQRAGYDAAEAITATRAAIECFLKLGVQ